MRLCIALLALLLAPAFLTGPDRGTIKAQDAEAVEENDSAEARIKDLEERLKRLEDRIKELESELADKGDDGADSGGKTEAPEDSEAEGDEAEGEDTAEAEEGDGETIDAEEYWERYKACFKEGRNWTYEVQGGIQMKQEVTSVDEEEAVLEVTTTMNGNAMGEPQETTLPLTRDDAGDRADDMPEWQFKEVTVEAGTFECMSPDGTNWMMKKYPIIIVKGNSMELIEFNE